MLASKPSRSVTGALPEPELLEPDAVGELDDDDEHPARKRAAATTAPTVAPIIGLRISLIFYLIYR
jgi:hypothetical protein